MVKKIYFDYAATTPVDPEVTESMLPYFSHYFGNPSSLHSFGTEAKEALRISRESLAEILNVLPDEVVFTSGGTESNNFAIKGFALANRDKGNHIIVSAIEHDCILNACKWLGTMGFDISYLSVNSDGLVDPSELKSLISPRTILVSVMHANNEIGTIQPLDEIIQICRFFNVALHTDACQSFGKIGHDQLKGADMISINAHKIYGPKGIGALIVKKGTRMTPLLHGGGQESGLRSTTENIPAIIGFTKAAEIAASELKQESVRIRSLRDDITSFLSEEFDTFYINGSPEQRLPGHINFSLHGFEGETIRLLLHLDEKGIAVSAGSACSSNDKTQSASHVLQAIGLNPFEARGGIRISLGRFTTKEHVEYLKKVIKESVDSLRGIYSGSSVN